MKRIIRKWLGIINQDYDIVRLNKDIRDIEDKMDDIGMDLNSMLDSIEDLRRKTDEIDSEFFFKVKLLEDITTKLICHQLKGKGGNISAKGAKKKRE